MKKICLLLISFAFISLSAQEYRQLRNFTETIPEYYQRMGTKLGIAEYRYEDIQGNAFIPENFTEGSMYMNDGRIFTGDLRYNMYRSNIEFQLNNGDIYEIFLPEKTKRVEIGDKTYHYVEKLGLFNKLMFMELLYEGDYSVYLHPTVKFFEAKPALPFKDPQPAHFSNKIETLYVAFPDKSMHKIKSTKTFLEIMDQKKGPLKSYIRKNRLNAKNAEDLVKIVSYYEENLR